MTITLKPTASGSTIEQDGSTILTVDGSGNITPSNQMYPKVPAFDVYASASQSISSGTWTKVTLDTELYDTFNCFDSTNNKFQPTVAGYYQLNGQIRFTNSGSLNQMVIGFYKNGSIHKLGQNLRDIVTTSTTHINISHLVYLNGTTDYIELYGFVAATSPVLTYTNTTGANCSMDGALVSV
jgi:hypothetical protein